MPSPATSITALELVGVSVPLRLRDVDLCLPPGKLVGLIGPNGSGKSTLLQAAGGVLDCTGTVAWSGNLLSKLTPLERGRRASWVPQESSFAFGFTVRSVVGQGRFAHGDDESGIDRALEKFELVDLADRPVNRLSGGERLRVMLARALATAAPLQLWDEPLAQLDPRHALETLQTMREFTSAGNTILFSLHDLRIAHGLDLVVVIEQGSVRVMGTPLSVLTPELLHAVFGVRIRSGEGIILELP